MFKKILASLFLVVLLAGSVFAATPYSQPNKNHSGQLGSWVSETSNYNRVWGGLYADYFYLSGGTEYEMTFTGTPTAARTITFPDSTGTVALTSGAASLTPSALNTYYVGTGALPWKGAYIGAAATNNILVTGTATAARTFTLPDASGYAMVSTLATNAPTVANSVWGSSNGLNFENAAGTFKTTIASSAAAADRVITLPDSTGTVVLNPVGLTWTFTGTSYNNVLTAAQPGAGRVTTFPDAGGTVMLSTLATNAPGVANSVTGSSNNLVFEGATGNSYATAITVVDPTAARTVTIPDGSGGMNLNCGVAHDYAAGNTAWTMTAAEAACGYIATTNAAVGGADAVLPACTAGKLYTVNNTSGQTVTLKVTGQTGIATVTAKKSIGVCTGTDVVMIYTQP